MLRTRSGKSHCLSKKVFADDFSVVFSFWTSTLDLIEQYIGERFKCIRFDGKVSNKERSERLSRFKNDIGVRVALLSISCGSVGYANAEVP
jgi:SNF2 family DNA or RNA helicase